MVANMRVVGASSVVLLLFSLMNEAVEPAEVVIAGNDGVGLQPQLLEERFFCVKEILKQFLFLFAHVFLSASSFTPFARSPTPDGLNFR